MTLTGLDSAAESGLIPGRPDVPDGCTCTATDLPTRPLRTRFAVKLVSNVLSFLLGFVTAGIIPKHLGPGAYGDLQFLSSFFDQAAGFLDGGTSTYFYTRLCKRPSDSGMVRFYTGLVGLTCFALIAIVTLTSLLSLGTVLWPAQRMRFILMALAVTIVATIARPLTQMADAWGLTVSLEIVKIVQLIAGVGILLGMRAMGMVNLTNVFGSRVLLNALLGLPLVVLLWSGGLRQALRERLALGEIRQLTHDFWDYVHPLAAYSLLAFVANLFDRWLLQLHGGSIQQGYFGLSSNLSVICMLFTSAMTPLIMREFSIAHQNRDRSEMARLYRRTVPTLHAVAAYFSCFLAVEADRVVGLIGGSGFTHAVLATRIMMFYPICQTYGQLTGSVFLATDQTRLYRNFGSLFLALGLPATYLAIAPTSHLGFDAGATGLAIKTVLIALLSVETALFYSSRLLGFSFGRYLIHQIGSVALFALIAIAGRAGLAHVPVIAGGNPWMAFFVSGVLYTSLCALIVGLLPQTAGLQREDLVRLIEAIQTRLGSQRTNDVSPL